MNAQSNTSFDYELSRKIEETPINWKSVASSYKSFIAGLGIGYVGAKTGTNVGVEEVGYGVALFGSAGVMLGKDIYQGVKHNLTPNGTICVNAESNIALGIGTVAGFTIGKLEEKIIPLIDKLN